MIAADLCISKMLNSHYKNPDQIAHKVLADRIGEREAGNKPQNGDRIPYVVCFLASLLDDERRK